MEQKLQKIVIPLCFVLFLSACNSVKTVPGSVVVGEQRFQRGLLQRQGEVLNFRACDSDFYVPVEAPSIELSARYQQLTAGLGSALYVEFTGEQDPLGHWRVSQLELAGGGLARCADQLPGIRYRIDSLPGEWQADIDDGQLRLRFPGRNRTLLFPLTGDKEQRRWSSEITADRFYMLELELEAAECIAPDGSYYDLKARLMLNGDISEGCARRGEPDQRLVAGEYLMQSPQRLIRLVLNRQGDAVLQQDYLNDQPMLSDRGRWRRLENGRLLLLLQGGEGRPPKPLLFESRAGVLQQRGFSPDFGQDGLRLYRADRPETEKES